MNHSPTLLFSFFGGLLTAFTPCVYPLIFITLGTFSSQKSISCVHSFFSSLIFVLGLSITYSILGLLSAFTGNVFGAFGQQPWVAFLIAFVFFLMGMSLLGLFEFRIPFQWNQWFSKISQPGKRGIFLLGVASGVLAAPCAGPMIVGILAYVTHQSKPFQGWLHLFFFGLGMGFPLLFLGTFSSWISKMPKSGIWLNWIKHTGGLLLFLGALLYIKPFLSPKVFFLLISLEILGVGIWIHKIYPLSSGQISTGHRMAQFFLFLLILAIGIGMGVLNWVKPSSSHSENLSWLSFEPQAIALAQEKKKPIFLDFWAEWCVGCHMLDKQTYSNSKVKKNLQENFILVKIDSSHDSLENERLRNKYQIMGLPTLVFLDSDGREIPETSIVGFINAEDFLIHLKKVENILKEKE